jgi:hypothetical protein
LSQPEINSVCVLFVVMPTKRKKKEKEKKGFLFWCPTFSSGVHNLCRSDADDADDTNPWEALVLFCLSLLCPIGAPSYTERRKDCASKVLCVCSCNRGRLRMAPCGEFALL